MPDDHIWLQPTCPGCAVERLWCEDDMGPCDECASPCVKYVKADVAEQEIARLQGELDAAKAAMDQRREHVGRGGG